MKKSPKKLRLSKDTVGNLEGTALRRAAGGETDIYACQGSGLSCGCPSPGTLRCMSQEWACITEGGDPC